MKYIKSLYTAIVVLLLTACQSEQWEGLEGGFIVSLEEEVTISTKSTPAELGKPDPELFKLKIVKESNGNTLYDGNFTGKTIPASAGLYTLTATCGDNPILALDAPYYKGEESGIEVTEGETTPVELKCSVANALTSVIYDEPEKFNDLYSSYALKIAVGNQSVTIGPSQTYKSAYYQAGTIPVFQFVGTLKDNGQEVSTTLDDERLKDAATFAAGKHCKLTLKVKPTESGVILTVGKVEIETVSISETIPVEWLPKPKITAEGFEGNTLTFAETESKTASIKLNTSSALQDMKFKFNFADKRFAAFNQEYQLSTLSEENRTNIETELGISLPTIGETSSIIQLDNLIAGLQTNAGETTNNTIEMDILANNRWSSEDETADRIYTLKCNKPEFSVSVNAANCWAREFTIDEITVTTGNKEIIENNLVYQYYDGANWIECTTREAEKGRTQQFQETANNIHTKTYKVRALYRGVIASTEAEATLEAPEQLSNAEMEEWYIEEKKKSGTWPFKDKTYYTFHPYTEGNASTAWWDTNNDKAQGGTYALGIWYEGCFASCVSYTEDAHAGTKAALMYVSGCGDGYANTSGTYVGGAMVGSLFIGKYNSGIVQGHDFVSRPSSLSFWYKYKPYNTDAFKVVVSLKNGDKDIATGIYEPTAYSAEDSEYQQATVQLNYNEGGGKATTICVQFLASNKTELSQNDFALGTTITYPVIGDWTVHMGSILKVDDISLIYDK